MRSFYEAYRAGKFKGESKDDIYIQRAAGIVEKAKARVREGYVREAVRSAALDELGKLGATIKASRLQEAEEYRKKADERAQNITSDRRGYASLHALEFAEARAAVGIMPATAVAGELLRIARGEIGANRAHVLALSERAGSLGLKSEILSEIHAGLERQSLFDPVEGDSEVRGYRAVAQQLEAEAERATVRLTRLDQVSEEGTPDTFSASLADLIDINEI
jgi:hypothetical protein